MRVFPAYFRVGFYGPKFGELDGKEFIYKVPGQIKLGHIQNQLKVFYFIFLQCIYL